MQIKALIVDDELHARENLKMLLEDNFPTIKLLGMASSAAEAKKLINERNPDLLFLDIKMPKQNGFDLLEMVPDLNFEVIFITAHTDHAIQAIKVGAIDYIEKPINVEELGKAIKRAEKRLKPNDRLKEQINAALKEALKTSEHDAIAVPTRDGLTLVKLAEIICLEANESYTQIFLTNGRKYLSSKNIKVFENLLDPMIFYRTHKSFIINKKYHLKFFSRREGNMAIMSEDFKVPISRRKLPDFLTSISNSLE